MRLINLSSLYAEMQRCGVCRYRFRFGINHVAFDVFFLADVVPYILLLGLRGGVFSIEFNVSEDFMVRPYIVQGKYYELCRVLGLRWNPDNKFDPKKFLEALDASVPRQVRVAQIPEPQNIAYYRRDLEDSNLVYFWQWRDNNARNQRVSHKNLEKTRVLLGQEAYRICRGRNISSVWTDDPSKASKVVLPD